MIDPADLQIAFEPLPPAVRARVAAMAIPHRFKRGQVLFRAGDEADGLYVVLSGRIRVSRETAHHVELLHTETDGGILGEIPVFGEGRFPATAVAVESSRCAKLPKAAIDRLLRDHPEFVRFALMRVATRARSLLGRIDELTATTITARVARHMLHRSDGSAAFTLGMSQAALAEEIGTAREVVVRAIAALVRAGAIERVGRSRFRVARPSTLVAMAGE